MNVSQGFTVIGLLWLLIAVQPASSHVLPTVGFVMAGYNLFISVALAVVGLFKKDDR